MKMKIALFLQYCLYCIFSAITVRRKSILKGLLERTFIVVSPYLNITQSLTLLGALKIATRIKDGEDGVSNDFFLIGNLISVLFGIGYLYY